jgi:hypothetical protein
VFKHCPVFAKPKDDSDGEPKLSPMEQLKQANIALQEENHRLTQKEDERFTPTDTAQHVAATLVGMFKPEKVRDIIRRAEELLKQRSKVKSELPA